MTARYRVTCKHCRRPVIAVDRIADPEFATLAGHIALEHPGEPPAEGAEAILRHFEVTERSAGEG